MIEDYSNSMLQARLDGRRTARPSAFQLMSRVPRPSFAWRGVRRRLQVVRLGFGFGVFLINLIPCYSQQMMSRAPSLKEVTRYTRETEMWPSAPLLLARLSTNLFLKGTVMHITLTYCVGLSRPVGTAPILRHQ